MGTDVAGLVLHVRPVQGLPQFLDCILSSDRLSRQTLLALADVVGDDTPIPNCGISIKDPFLNELANLAGALDKKSPNQAKDIKHKKKVEAKSFDTLGEKS